MCRTKKKAAATSVAATGTPVLLSKDYPSQGFLLDILSDNQQVSIHRLQAFLFNVVFGCWFIYKTFVQLKGADTSSSADAVNAILPVLGDSNLVLLGISAGTYTILKASENSSVTNP